MQNYPKPQRAGGLLIREVIRSLRAAGLQLPITSDIQIACSSGPDSTALAILLARYGRKISKPKQLKLLHINHHWQEGASRDFVKAVRNLAKGLNLSVQVLGLKKKPKKGDSLEGIGHRERRRIFQKKVAGGDLVFTAHQGDDLAETLIWRFFTGSYSNSEQGILLNDGGIVRPFLRVPKKLILEFLKEEGALYLEDPMNADSSVLRVKIRTILMPAVRQVFLKANENLIRMGANGQPVNFEACREIFDRFEQASGAQLRVRRVWIEALAKQLNRSDRGITRTSLSNDWQMTVSPDEMVFKRRIT